MTKTDCVISMTQTDVIGLFEPSTKNILKLLGDADSFYFIPDYQRPYSWTDDQVEELWDDLFDAWENKLEAYFLGPMIFIRSSNGEFEVVDGQQRLATLIILFCVLRNEKLSQNNNILNSIKSIVNNKPRIKLVPQHKNYDQLINQIVNNKNLPRDKPTRNELGNNPLLNTLYIFKEKLKEFEKNKIESFVNYIFNKVVVITIICSHKTHAIKLFQTLNTRGLDLSTADLIKSTLMYSLEQQAGNSTGDAYKREMERFKDTWAKIEALQENVFEKQDENLDSLFTYYAYYRLSRNLKTSLYDELERDFRNGDPNKVLLEFYNFLKIYSSIVNEDSKILFSFLYLPNQVYWKAILITAKLEKFRKFYELARELRDMYYCYWIAGYNTAKVKQISFNIIRWIKEKRTISFIRNEITTKWKDDSVGYYVNENLYKNAYGKRWLTPLLILLEYKQTDDSKINFIHWGPRIHVEHVLPQNWEKEKKWDKVWKKEDAEKWVNMLGNLTLLSGKKNQGAGNKSFHDKKQIYNRKKEGRTSFEISKIITENNKWTISEVKRRHKKLIVEIEELFEIESDN